MSSSFSFSFVILNFIIMRTKNLYGINDKSNGVGVVRVRAVSVIGFGDLAYRGRLFEVWLALTVG